MDPVACVQGDIFCRECALSNIIAQKKEIKRLDKTREAEERDVAEDKARLDEEAQARAVKEFELVQAGFDVQETADRRSGEKRKAPTDEDDGDGAGQGERAKARKANADDNVGFEASCNASHELRLLILCADRKIYPSVFLGSICNTNVQQQGQVARDQKESQDIPCLPIIEREPAS